MNTDFQYGDPVWFLDGLKAKKAAISRKITLEDKDGTRIRFILASTWERCASEVFSTRKALIASISS